MMIKKNILVFLILAFFSCASIAQTNVAKPKVVKDTSAPKLVVKFGPYADSSKTVVSAMKQLLKNELKVTDNKGGIYSIVKFNFAWRKKDVTDDFKTGIPKTIFLYNETSVVGDAHIPDSWQKELQQNLQSKEELFFDEILAQNTKTKQLVKPGSLRLLIQ
jgi:hypothetical protein